MKKNAILTLSVAAALVSFTACNDNASTSTPNADSPTTMAPVDNTEMSTTSTGDYAAWADSLEVNSQAGYYLNPKTSKPYKFKVDRTTGQVMDENNEAVWRYVDNRNWWVYGLNDSDWTWDSVGHAKSQNDKLMYEGDNGNWSAYDEEWSAADEKTTKSWKDKSNGVKIKVSRDGDIKVKDESGKVKYDADDDKIKTKP